MKIQHILVPTDFSKTSINALEYAVELAYITKAKLSLLHVYFVVDPEIRDKNIKKLKQLAADLKVFMKKKFSTQIQFELIVNQGFTVDEIQLVSEKKKADIIVMGMTGANGLKEVLIGSNTYNVIKKTNKPVLALPESSGFKKIKNIAFAINLKEKSKNTSKQLTDFSGLFNANIYIVHINTENYDLSNELDQYLREFNINHSYPGIQICEIKDKDIHHGLEVFINENKIDLIAMTAHKKNIFESIFRKSITEKMVFHTNIPLLVFQQ